MAMDNEESSLDQLRGRVRDLEKSHRALRLIVNLVPATAVMVTSSAWYYLFRQTSFTRRVADDTARRVAVFQANQLPRYQAFVNQLQGHARTNSEVAAILKRHSIAAPGGSSPEGGGAAPWENSTLPAAE